MAEPTRREDWSRNFCLNTCPGIRKPSYKICRGGGSTIANNHFAANAKPDGLTLLQDSSSALGNFTRGGTRINYDPRNRVIASVARGGSVLLVRKEGVNSLSDPKPRKLVVGD
jgi:hypothetical protein